MKLYLHYLSLHMKTIMQYKGSFWMTSFGQLLNALSALAVVWILMGRFGQVEGYSAGEVFLCFGTVNMAFALAELFFRGFDAFAGTVRTGEFDRILVRPRNEIFQVLVSKLELTRWVRILEGAAVLLVGVGICGICRVMVGGQRKLTCIDGPTFDAHLVDFDQLLNRQRHYI